MSALEDVVGPRPIGSIRFFNGESEVTLTESALENFERRLREARYDYLKATAQEPDHLVLGKREFAEYHAMMEFKIAMGHLTRSYDGPPKMCYRGMNILQSSLDTLLVAARSPVG